MGSRIWIIKIVVLGTTAISSFLCQRVTESVESKLLRHLTQAQSPAAFPHLEDGKTLNLTFSLGLRRILKVNERSHVIKTRLWIRQKWKNELMVWNASEWGGVKSISFPATSVWTPDTVLYNSVDAEIFPGGTELYKTAVVGLSDGTHRWTAPVTLQTTCTIGVQYFPADEQTCHFQFGSWSQDIKKINIYPDKAERISNHFINGPEWDLVSVSTYRQVKKYDCCPGDFVTVFFYITIRRRGLYYVITLVIPCLLVLSLTLVSFFLPPDSGERIGLTMAILLAVALFLQLTSEILPTFSKNTPYISLFFVSIMLITTLSLFVTGFVLMLHFKKSAGARSKMPPWMKKYLVVKLGRMLMIEEVKNWTTQEQNLKANTLFYQNGSVKKVISGDNREDPALKDDVTTPEGISCTFSDSTLVQEAAKCNELQTRLLSRVLQHVSLFSTHLKDTEKQEDVVRDWRLLAMVLDRLLLVVFTIASFALSAAFLQPIYTH